MIIELEKKQINLKKTKEPILASIIIKLIEQQHQNRENIIEYIFSENKKIKMFYI